MIRQPSSERRIAARCIALYIILHCSMRLTLLRPSLGVSSLDLGPFIIWAAHFFCQPGFAIKGAGGLSAAAHPTQPSRCRARPMKCVTILTSPRRNFSLNGTRKSPLNMFRLSAVSQIRAAISAAHAPEKPRIDNSHSNINSLFVNLSARRSFVESRSRRSRTQTQSEKQIKA